MDYPPPCDNELLNSGLETLLEFIEQKMQSVLRMIGHTPQETIRKSEDYSYLDWMSYFALLALESVEDIIATNYNSSLDAEKTRIYKVFVLVHAAVASFIIFTHFFILIWLKNGYQRANRILLMFPDSMLVKNEPIMQGLFGEKRN